MHVDKVDTVAEFQEVARKYFRRADEIVVQRFVPSRFDWRVTTLNGEVLFVCKYVMPGSSWKIQRNDNGHIIWAKIEAVDPSTVDPRLLEIGLRAADAIGKGLYGVDHQGDRRRVRGHRSERQPEHRRRGRGRPQPGDLRAHRPVPGRQFLISVSWVTLQEAMGAARSLYPSIRCRTGRPRCRGSIGAHHE